MITTTLFVAPLLILFITPSLSIAQSFTKVTDPSNPVVTDQFESGGGSWADFNNDGYIDLFVANGNLSDQANSLYLNDGGGGFLRVTTGSIITDGGSSIGGAWGDFNHDGNVDLFVTNRNHFGNFLYEGTGDTTFIKVIAGQIVTDIGNSNSSSWVDIESDGDLDLFVVNFGEDNYLYRNDGDPAFGFTRVDTGEIVNDGTAFSISGTWGDMNGDQQPDFFMGNAGSSDDDLYRNLANGAFTREAFSDGRSTLGGSWGDYDNDGDQDLFVANFLVQGNILYDNTGAPDYNLVPVDTGAVSGDAANSVGSSWGDVDNDGDLDLFVANDGEANFLYTNSGPPDYAFTKITSGPLVTEASNSFGTVFGDYDNDGDLDLFVANRLNQQNFLYRNDETGNNWMKIRLTGVSSTMSAFGASVMVWATINGTPVLQSREVPGQTGYNSQNPEIHFGLGDATIADSIVILWPSGTREFLQSIATNNSYAAVEGQGFVVGVDDPPGTIPVQFSLSQNYPNPFNPVTRINYSLPVASRVTLRIYNILGQEVATLIDGIQGAGYRIQEWDAAGVGSGVYFYRIEVRSASTNEVFRSVKKMMLLR